MYVEHTAKEAKGSGWIEVICGSMFSGKTEELIRRLKRARIATQRVEIFKPRIDDRYHEADVVSHDENAIPSVPVDSASDILQYASSFDVIGVDEAQFFDEELPKVCNELANRGVRVVVAGLDMDHKGDPFGPMPQMLAIAEFVTKVHAICVRTGKLANYSHRLTDSGSLISLGGKDEYEPLSREAFYKATHEAQKGSGTDQTEEED